MVDSEELLAVAVETAIVLGIAAVFLHHAYRMYRGTRARTGAVIAWAVLYGSFAGFAILETLVPFPESDVEVTVFLAVLNAAVAVVAAVWTFRKVPHVATWAWGPNRSLRYHVGPFIPVLYATLFSIEIIIHLVMLGAIAPGITDSPESLPLPILTFLRVADLCLSATAGIIVGLSSALLLELYRGPGPPAESP